MSYQDVYIFTHQKQFSFHAREEILHHIDVPEKILVDKGGGRSCNGSPAFPPHTEYISKSFQSGEISKVIL